VSLTHDESPKLPFRESPADLDLAADDVHVWFARVVDIRDIMVACTNLLSAPEQARAEKFKFARDRDLFVATHVALRSILARYLKQSAMDIDFGTGPNGKPSLAAGSSRHVSFNLSHSGGLAMIAVASCREVGVDVELIKQDFAFDEIAERFFTAREVAALRALPDDVRCQGFFKCWTSKEAFLKAKGTGLSGELDEIEITLDQDGQVQIAASIPGWSLAEINPGEDYVAALVTQGEPVRIHLYQWTPQLL
jgi:4'-phosphopantetheinyl transferase